MKTVAVQTFQFYTLVLLITCAAYMVLNWGVYAGTIELFLHALTKAVIWPVSFVKWLF